MTRDGEYLLFLDADGFPEVRNTWAVEVEAVAHYGEAMPERVAAFETKSLLTRDLTTAFEMAVWEAIQPEARFPSSHVIRQGRAA